MSETQLFSNNAETTLNGAITNVAVSITVTDGTVFNAPTGTEYEYATIDDNTNVEIVKITGVAANVLTVVRGADGTTGTAFATGVKIASRVTAGSLDRFVQNDIGGDARGADAVNIQPSRTGATQVASGSSAVAVGKSTTASAFAGVAVGNLSSATASEAVAVGSSASATASSAVAISVDAGASAANSIAIGTQTISGGIDTVALGNTSGNASAYCAAITVGKDISISGRATPYNVSLGKTDYSVAGYTTSLAGPDYLPLEQGAYIGGTTAASHHLMQATERTFFSPPVQAGVKVWVTATAYNHNEVITPTTPNGYSYYARLASPYGGTVNSSGAEPTWPTANGATVDEGNITWVCVDNANIAFYQADYLRFIPTEVGFIGDTDTASGGTQPTISWGIVGSTAKWKAATITTLITNPYSLQMFAPTNTEGNDNMSAAVTVLGTGVKSGRVYWKGLCVETLTA